MRRYRGKIVLEVLIMKREKNEHRKMPEPIDATPEEVARAIMQRPPKKKWDFMQKRKKKK